MSMGVQEVDLIVKGPGPGREIAIRAVQSMGVKVRSISDVTPVAAQWLPASQETPRVRREGRYGKIYWSGMQIMPA